MYFDMCTNTESHVHMLLNCLPTKMTKHMSWNASREWGGRRPAHSAVLPWICPTSFVLFGIIEVKIFIWQHENSGELCLSKSYWDKFCHLAFSLPHPTITTAVKPYQFHVSALNSQKWTKNKRLTCSSFGDFFCQFKDHCRSIILIPG